MSLLTTCEALPLPGDLTPVGHRRTLILVLARHTAGTLDYDEFAMGTAARHGRRLGLYCHRIWVSSMTSVRGGRHLWGIPKELARFTWTGGNVRITADTGPVATVRLSRKRGWRIPAGRLPGHGFGQIGARRLFLPGRISGQLGLSRVTVTQWGDALPGLRRTTSLLALSIAPASFTFPQASTLGRAVGQVGDAGGA